MKKILVLGSNNACHSLMMAALIKHISYDRIDVQSAAVRPGKVDPLAQKVLQEIGIDLSKEKNHTINEFLHTKFDIIITTSKDAQDKVNTLMSSTTKIHKEFDDPRKIKGSKFDKENAYRELRDEMQEWLNEFVQRHRLI